MTYKKPGLIPPNYIQRKKMNLTLYIIFLFICKERAENLYQVNSSFSWVLRYA